MVGVIRAQTEQKYRVVLQHAVTRRLCPTGFTLVREVRVHGAASVVASRSRACAESKHTIVWGVHASIPHVIYLLTSTQPTPIAAPSAPNVRKLPR
jgi:hypothetical protein